MASWSSRTTKGMFTPQQIYRCPRCLAPWGHNPLMFKIVHTVTGETQMVCESCWRGFHAKLSDDKRDANRRQNRRQNRPEGLTGDDESGQLRFNLD